MSQAAAPLPPQLETSTSASTSSLVDVDSPSVRTVPSDYAEHDIKTKTQAARIELEKSQKEERERAAIEEAEAKARAEKDFAKKKAKRADNWLINQLAGMSKGGKSALVIANALLVVGLSGLLGYRGWLLQERRAFGWKHVGIGAVIVGGVALFESAFARYVQKSRNRK